MDQVVSVLMRIIALCVFAAFCDLLLSSGKLLSGVRLVSGLLVVESAAELVYQLIAMLQIA